MTDWLRGNTTGDTLIHTGVPEGWAVGDKSEAGSYGTRNDIAIVWPPDRDPIVIAILSSRNTEDATYDDALIAEATKIVINALNNIQIRWKPYPVFLFSILLIGYIDQKCSLQLNI